jgi:catechol 2,3-dioxygenase-like lactoylglutathione lyase family enzyme
VCRYAWSMTKITLIALGVSDIAKSVEFYSRKAGFELQNQFGSLAFFTAGPVTLMLNGGLRRPGAQLAGAMEIVVAAERRRAPGQRHSPILTATGSRYSDQSSESCLHRRRASTRVVSS